MNTIFIVTEANATVATGHLMECIVCAEELMESGYDVSFWINDDMEEGLKKRIPCMFWEYHISIENDYEMLLLFTEEQTQSLRYARQLYS